MPSENATNSGSSAYPRIDFIYIGVIFHLWHPSSTYTRESRFNQTYFIVKKSLHFVEKLYEFVLRSSLEKKKFYTLPCNSFYFTTKIDGFLQTIKGCSKSIPNHFRSTLFYPQLGTLLIIFHSLHHRTLTIIFPFWWEAQCFNNNC